MVFSEQTTDQKYSLFFDAKVQELLKRLTETDLEKVYLKKKLGGNPQTPEYKFMTDEELAVVNFFWITIFIRIKTILLLYFVSIHPDHC